MNKGTRRLVAVSLWILILIPANALVHSFAASELWAWFLRRHYGAGPSLGEWFGISCIATMALMGLARSTSKTEEASIAAPILNSWFTIALLLALAYGVGSVFGWVG